MMKKNRHPLIKSALILTAAGLISRIIGFYYKIFLASMIGAEGIGIYQMIFPLYVLCVSLSSSGIQTAVSRFTAEYLSTGHPQKARALFRTGLLMSLAVSGLLALLLHTFSVPVGLYFLKEERCIPLLRLIAFAIPFEAIHTCASGYFLGQQKPGVPAISQLLEQTVRVGSTFLLYQLLLEQGLTPSPLLAAAGLLAGEAAAAMIVLTRLALQTQPKKDVSGNNHKKRKNLRGIPENQLRTGEVHKQSLQFQNLTAICKVAAPINLNRLLLNLLHSGEAAMIPIRLQQYYKNTGHALAAYGIFTGMAMPLIMFPCAITSSLSMVLLPSISEACAVNDTKKITATVESTMLLCLSLGITFTAAFLEFGPSMGALLYQNDRVGSYLTTLAWICPFLYLTATNNGILLGLGKTKAVFLHSLTGQLIHLGSSYFLIPLLGMQGCLIGLLISQLTTALLGMRILQKEVSFTFHAVSWILKPAGCCILALLLLKLLQHLFPILSLEHRWSSFLLSGSIWGLAVLTLHLLFLKKAARHQHSSLPE